MLIKISITLKYSLMGQKLKTEYRPSLIHSNDKEIKIPSFFSMYTDVFIALSRTNTKPKKKKNIKKLLFRKLSNH